MNITTLQTRDVLLPQDLENIRKLWFEYIVWGIEKMQSLYGVHPHNPKEAV